MRAYLARDIAAEHVSKLLVMIYLFFHVFRLLFFVVSMLVCVFARNSVLSEKSLKFKVVLHTTNRSQLTRSRQVSLFLVA